MIILCGIKHCGKSTIGKKLAKKLNTSFVDVDKEIEKIAGKSCRDLYRQDGKEAFMKAEAKACKNIAENPLYENAVVATGGGICDNQEALDFLTETKLFYVDIEEEIAFKRIQHNMEKTGSWPAWIPKDVYDDLEDGQNQLIKSANAIRNTRNVSYFAFTATPKKETMELFGTRTEFGKSYFDKYSMRQAIEERFILNPLLRLR